MLSKDSMDEMNGNGWPKRKKIVKFTTKRFLLILSKYAIIGTLSESEPQAKDELSVSNTWTLNELDPQANREFSVNGIIGTLSNWKRRSGG